MFVREWMSSPAITIGSSNTAKGTLEFMEARKIRRLPVVEGDSLVGIVTKSDLLARKPKRDKSVQDVMARSVATAAPDDTLECAAQIMLQGKISGLPVVEENKVIGIITESDLFRALCAMLGIGEASARIVMTVPGDQDLLGAISSKLQGKELRSMATYRNLFQNRWEVALRVRSLER